MDSGLIWLKRHLLGNSYYLTPNLTSLPLPLLPILIYLAIPLGSQGSTSYEWENNLWWYISMQGGLTIALLR